MEIIIDLFLEAFFFGATSSLLESLETGTVVLCFLETLLSGFSFPLLESESSATAFLFLEFFFGDVSESMEKDTECFFFFLSLLFTKSLLTRAKAAISMFFAIF